jgi:hypothetical protein
MTTSEKDFEIFKEEIRFWLKFFNLLNWDIDYHHEELDVGDLANVMGNYTQYHADIRFNEHWCEEYYSEEQIRKVAFHEVVEILLMEIRQLAHLRFVAPEQIEASLHGVIQRLTNTIWRNKHVLLKETS